MYITAPPPLKYYLYHWILVIGCRICVVIFCTVFHYLLLMSYLYRCIRSGMTGHNIFHSRQRRSTTVTNTFAFTSSRGDVHWTVAVVSQRVCDSSRSPLSAYSELRPVIPVQTLHKSSAVAEMGDRLATIDMGWRGGLLCSFPGGGAGRHQTQCGLGRYLLPYQVASWSIQPFGHNRYGPNIGDSAPFLGRGAGSPSSTMWPRPTSMPSLFLSHWTIWPQHTNVTDRQERQTDNGVIA